MNKLLVSGSSGLIGSEVVEYFGLKYCNSIYQFELVSQIAAKVNFSWHAEKLARESYLKGVRPSFDTFSSYRNLCPVKLSSNRLKGYSLS